MPTCLVAPPAVDLTPGWVSGQSAASATNTTNATANATLTVARHGAFVCGVITHHGNWIPTLGSKSLVSNLGSTFTELADVRRGIPGQDNGHVILYYCQDPVVGTHTLTANVTAGQGFDMFLLANFYKNIAGYRSLTTQTSGGSNAAVNLGIASNAGNIPFAAISADPIPAGQNWNARQNSANNFRMTGDRGVTVATGTVSFSSSSTNHWVAAAGIDLIAG